ncbi:MAG: BON domain-containing protein [Thermodesulfovibrionales bacterium]|nr:BON domain-containing protein [Thermodesulfovibrionales bacterium]
MKRAVFFVILVVFVSGCASVTGRTAGETIDDSSITSEINLLIIKDPDLKYLKINVDTFRGYVTLTGVVPNKKAEQRLIDLSKQVRGVRSVTSNLMIEGK